MKKQSEGCLDCEGVGYHNGAIGEPPYECETCFDQEPDWPDWVDVTNSLPREDGMLVVVFDPTNNPTVWPAKWDKDNQSFSSNGGWFEANEVTHWMPLPPPPKSKEWLEGFAAADYDEKADQMRHDFTHNPYEPTSPYTYNDYHCGPPTKQSSDWSVGYHFRQFQHQRSVIQCKIIINTGSGIIETYM